MEAAARAAGSAATEAGPDLHQALDVGVDAGQRAEQAPGVRVVRPREDFVDRPSSAICPAYITTTSSAISATTPRSWVIIMIAVSNSSWSSHQLQICAWIVTSRAVVGSSAISSSGLHDRGPWRSSRAGACRPRTGAGSRRCAVGARDADRLEQLDRALRVLLRSRRGAAHRLDELLADRVHRVQRRHRILEDHRDVVAAEALQLVAAASAAGPRR